MSLAKLVIYASLSLSVQPFLQKKCFPEDISSYVYIRCTPYLIQVRYAK